MARSLKDVLGKLREAAKGNPSPEAPRDETPPRDAVIAHFGIDFGTRFTKVSVHLPRRDERVTLALAGNGERLLPSRVAVADGRAYPPDLPAPTDATWVDYLKMRLGAGGEMAFGESTPRPHDHVKALAALYLAGVLRLAHSAARGGGLLPKQGTVQALAQVGVPVQTYDSRDLGVFEEVSAVAWAWKDEAPTAQSLAELISRYHGVAPVRFERSESPITVVPELVAAISHIASRRDAPEGIYAFIDIGGGTLDGTVFRLTRAPTPTVTIYAAEVARLGTIAIARQLSGSIEAAEERLIVGGLTSADRRVLAGVQRKVCLVLHKIVAQAAMKTSVLDFVALGGSDLDRRMRTGAYATVPLMLAGGGATSAWYQKVFESHDMSSRLVGEFRIRVVPRPPGSVENDYPRFVVANGLSVMDLELRHKYILPSDVPAAAHPQVKIANLDVPISKDAV